MATIEGHARCRTRTLEAIPAARGDAIHIGRKCHGSHREVAAYGGRACPDGRYEVLWGFAAPDPT